jgi:hypothetical protein
MTTSVAVVQANAMPTPLVVKINPVDLCHCVEKINQTKSFCSVLPWGVLHLFFTMTNQAVYRSFAAGAPDLPLFLEPWYLDAVCAEGVWDVALVEKEGRIVAAWPYFLKKKWCWVYVAMPRLCKFLGPYLLPEYRNLNGETRLYEALMVQFPTGLAAFQQDLNYSVANWLPMYWRGFRQTTRYSYTLSLASSEVSIFENISRNYRQKIRAAEAKLVVVSDRPVSELLRLVVLSFARQGLPAPLTSDFFTRLYEVLESRGCCRLFFAVDPTSGAVHSGALLAWDSGSAYYLVSGDDPVLRASGSALLLKWEAIRYAKNVLKAPVFDFEGSMIRAIETGRRDFGAQQKPYFRVQCEWSPVWRWRKCMVR